MKAEHRRELQTNVLAERMGQLAQSFKEGPSRGTIIVVSVLVVVVLLFYAWRYISQSSEETEAARWYEWDSINSPAQLKAFVDNKEAQGSLQGKLARFQQARRDLSDGLARLGVTRTDALASIKRAAETYGKLADECDDHPLLQQEALLGAAKANEALNEIDKARTLYKRLADKFPSTAMGKSAQKQLARLDKSSTDKDLEQLSKELNLGSAGTP
jgi:hypothetical protein